MSEVAAKPNLSLSKISQIVGPMTGLIVQPTIGAHRFRYRSIVMGLPSAVGPVTPNLC